MMPYLYFKPFAVKPRVLAVFPVRVAGRCEGGDVTALSCSHIDRRKLPQIGWKSPAAQRPAQTGQRAAASQGRGSFPSPGHCRPHMASQGNTGRFLGRLQGCSPFSGLHPCTLGRLAASRTTGPLVSRRGRPDSFSRSSVSAPKSLPQ